MYCVYTNNVINDNSLPLTVCTQKEIPNWRLYTSLQRIQCQQQLHRPTATGAYYKVLHDPGPQTCHGVHHQSPELQHSRPQWSQQWGGNEDKGR